MPRLARLWFASLLALCLLAPAVLRADGQSAPAPPPGAPAQEEAIAAPPLEFRLESGGREWLRPDEEVEIVATRPLEASDGRFALFLGTTDVTEMFVRTPQGFRRPSSAVRLPPGESKLVIYQIDTANDWRPAGEIPLKVLTRAGFETATFQPRLDMGGEGRFSDAGGGGLSSGGQDPDGTGQLALGLDLVRSGTSVKVAANVSGVTNRGRALRSASLGEEAPLVDLASYSVEVRRQGAALLVGHVAFGEHPHLAQAFSSRGAMLQFAGRRVEVRAGAFEGTAAVGWDNPLGVRESENRLFGGMLRFDLLASRPGAVKLEATFVDGSRLPLGSFNRAFVNDAEKSRGVGVRLLAGLASGRLRLEAGWAESRFTNPRDPTLDGDVPVVPVQEETRNAIYAAASADVLRGSLSPSLPTALTLSYRFERVDPLYRSIAATPQADLEQQTLDATFSAGPITAQASAAMTHDNLEEIPTLLKTDGRRAGAQLAVPLGSLVGGSASRWLPSLSYTFASARQEGSVDLEAGGFPVAFVPDQETRSHTGSASWQWQWWRFAYRTAYSFVDNRQEGRERADTRNRANGLGAGINFPAIQLSADFDEERVSSLETAAEGRTRRYAVQAAWTPGSLFSFSSTFSRTRSRPDRNAATTDTLGFDAQVGLKLTRGFAPPRGVSGQLFVRYGWRETRLPGAAIGGSGGGEHSVSVGINAGVF